MNKRSKRLIAILLVLCISMVSTNLDVFAKEGVGSLQTSTQATVSNNDPQAPQEEQTWDGVITTDVFEGENYRITYTLTGHWNGGYNAKIQIDNTGSETIENWKLNFDYPGTISNIWNAVIKSHEGSQYRIQNAQWNQDIEPGKSVAFGISGNEDFKGFAKQYELQGELADLDAQAYSVQYTLKKDWKSGFNSEITITNQRETILEDWVLEFDYSRTITSIWNATIISHEGTHYVIKNAGYNSNIAPYKTITFGFNGKDGAKADEPSNYKLCSYSDSVIEKPVQDLVLSANTQDLFYNEAGNFYVVDQPITTLSGTVSDSTKVKKSSYEIKDIKGNLVKAGTIPVQTNWVIDPFGLALGYNELTITAMLKANQKITTSVRFMNFDASNMERTNVDLSDTDGDGINNYFESILGTDPKKADTDGDQLSDFDEFTKVGTDPTKQDTDANGVLDGAEDLDQDGLNHLLEIKYGTNCYSKDTDYDGFLDGEEVSKYQTNPIVVDTDEDGLSDREDVNLNFSPINPDTNGNGILDGKEVITQTCNQPIDTTRKAGITNVSVQLACDGAIDNRVTIIDTYDLDMKSSDVVGLVGVPVEISTDASFTTADITFTYDETALGEVRV